MSWHCGRSRPEPNRARYLGAALIAVLAVALSLPAAAESRRKRPLPGEGLDPIVFSTDIPAQRSRAAEAAPPAPARFFTINQVLAKRDAVATSGRVRIAKADATATDAPAIGTATAPRGPEPFGLFAFRAPEGLLWTKWRGVEADIARETEAVAACREALAFCYDTAALKFIGLVAEARRHDGLARLAAVNRSVNAAIRYVSDMEQHGVADLWSAPLATLASGRGDCEDYAIAKFVILREAGVAESDLRLVLARDRAAGADHAVLAVRQDGSWLILDNRWTAMRPDDESRHLQPLFGIDNQGVKLFAAPYAARDAAPAGIAPATAGWGEDDDLGAAALSLFM